MATQEQLDLRKKWVEALRSGEYKQGTGYLNNNGNYCCLGVLCELVGVEWTKDPLEPEGIKAIKEPSMFHEEKSIFNSTIPSDKIVELVGLQDNEGTFMTYEDPDGDSWNNEYNTLVNLNDEEGKTFSEIADIIESNPKGLFVD